MTYGVSASTHDRLVLDAGAIYVDYGLGGQRCLGATLGGAVFNRGIEFKDDDVDNAPGVIKDLKWTIRSIPTLTCTLKEMTLDNLEMVQPGTTKSTPDAATRTHFRGTADLDDITYHTNVALVARTSTTGENLVIYLYNALVTEAEFSTINDDEARWSVTFTGHYDMDDTDGYGRPLEPCEVVVVELP